jgi:glycosyltransferase involved in cell wall biosynthesis
MNIHRGVAICHYNRIEHLEEVIKAVKETVPEGTRIVVCDDGSTPMPDPERSMMHSTAAFHLEDITRRQEVVLIKGPNLGVAANKNRALWALQDCHYICILEDDLVPTEKGWFEAYEKASLLAECHHFCRIQDKEIPETVPTFQTFMNAHGLHPIYASSPRGDLTFCTSEAVKRVGAFNPRFRGAGYAHGEWSARVARTGLIGHPLLWMDIVEGRDKFKQLGDREGGRWLIDEGEIKAQLKRNARVLKELNVENYIYHPLVLE